MRDLSRLGRQPRTAALDEKQWLCPRPACPATLDGHVSPGGAAGVMDKHDEGPYLDVKMPERFLLQFRLYVGSWMDEAICLRRRFERLDNGRYICSEFSSGLWIRCIAAHGYHFEHVVGGGNVHRYRLLPLLMPVGAD